MSFIRSSLALMGLALLALGIFAIATFDPYYGDNVTTILTDAGILFSGVIALILGLGIDIDLED